MRTIFKIFCIAKESLLVEEIWFDNILMQQQNNRKMKNSNIFLGCWENTYDGLAITGKMDDSGSSVSWNILRLFKKAQFPKRWVLRSGKTNNDEHTGGVDKKAG